MLSINDEEKNILLTEIQYLIDNSSYNERQKQELKLLQASIINKSLDDNQLSVFCYVLEMLLSSGDIRNKYGYKEELLIFRLYKSTPWGKEREDNLKKINNTLTALTDHKIEKISFSLKLPGVYSLEIITDKCQVSFEVNQFQISPDKIELEL